MAVCSACDPSEFDALEGLRSYRTFEPGETIAWTGRPMTHVGSVVSGVALLSNTLSDGRRQMVGLLLPSDFLG